MKVFVSVVGTLMFVVAANNAVALVLWLLFRFAWWPLLAPSCLYTPNALPAAPPQDYLINLAIFIPASAFAWNLSRRRKKRTV